MHTRIDLRRAPVTEIIRYPRGTSARGSAASRNSWGDFYEESCIGRCRIHSDGPV
jgi:hypothetical protein